MTSERRLVFDLADVRGLVVECNKCSGNVTVPVRPNLRSDFLDRCAICGEDLLTYDNRAEVVKHAFSALATLGKLVALADLPVTIKLEFAESAGLLGRPTPSE